MMAILVGIVGYSLGTLFFMASVVSLNEAAEMPPGDRRKLTQKGGINCSVFALASFFATTTIIKFLP